LEESRPSSQARNGLRRDLKVFVGIPLLGTGKDCEKYLSRATETIANQKTQVEILPPLVYGTGNKGTQRDLVAKSLNFIINEFLKTDCTHIWICNADTEYPEDAVETLIRHDVDLASGICPVHSDWNNVTVGWEHKKGGIYWWRRMQLEGKVVGRDEHVVTGNFCILAKRRVFEAYPTGKLRFVVGRQEKYMYGTEIQFWIDAQDAGLSARIDGNVVCGHLPEWPLGFVGPEDIEFIRTQEAKWE